MKKILLFLCICSILFSLIACGNHEEGTQSESNTDQQTVTDQITDPGTSETSDAVSEATESDTPSKEPESTTSDESSESAVSTETTQPETETSSSDDSEQTPVTEPTVPSETEANQDQTQQPESKPETSPEPQPEDPPESQPEPPITEEEPDMLKIEILVGNKTFSATLYDNEAARTLIDMLPLTLNMSELNGNEKYYYLDKSLPTNASRPSGIKTGDIMLYGNSCLVLFYESFSTSYSYTPIGHIDDPTGLAAALGSGSVQVTFRKG